MSEPTIDVTTHISIVICNHNGATPLQQTIPSLLTQQGVRVTDILLVDNQSADESLTMVRERFPGVKIISTGSNRGPNVARNTGLRAAKTGLVLIMDNDLVLAPDYIARLSAVFLEHPQAGAVTGRIVFHDNPSMTQYNGVDIHYAGEIRPHDFTARGVRPCAAVSAGATLYRKSAVEAVGWFDEDFVFGWEDGDLAFRLSLAGYSCWVDSDAVAEHQSQPRGFKWVRYQVRNRWWFLRRNYERRTFWLCLPAILLFQVLAGVIFMLRGQGIAFLRGTLDGWGSGAMIRKKYEETQRLRKESDADLLVGDFFSLPVGVFSSGIGKAAARALFGAFAGYWWLIKLLVKKKR